MATLIQELSQIGEVTLVRYVGETMWITFRDGQSALTAVQKKTASINGITLHFKLKSDNWVKQVEEEIDLCTTNTVRLCDVQCTHGLSASAIPDYNALGIPKVPPQRPKSPASKLPPSRPPLPKSPKHLPKAGVISVVPELLNKTKPVMPPPMQPIQVVQGHQQNQSPTHVSSGSSPSHSISSPPSQPQDLSAAIYEEISDDIVSIYYIHL